jgi:SagB-type dehydrogenase family enzyme
MNSDTLLRTYALAPDAQVELVSGGAFLRTPTSRNWVASTGELTILELLAGSGISEADICRRLRLTEPDRNAEIQVADVLYRLDRQGLLTRRLNSGGRRLVSCVPLRPPPGTPRESPPEGALRLSPHALACAEEHLISLEAPGSWARIAIHDRELLPLLYDLAVGRTAAEITAAAVGHFEDAIVAILALISWCGLLNDADHEGWPSHDLLFHARTRRGYSRVLLGKTRPRSEISDEPAVSGISCLTLDLPDLRRLVAQDPPFALVSERRRSARQQGSLALTLGQLSEFLFRTLHERGGRRPYPSGGACYPLKAYLAVHRCRGLERGLYGYDPSLHELILLSTPGPSIDRLLADAAGAADIDSPPQILLVLAARYARTQRVYGDLSYSLILKEVGAVFQGAMMAASAMGLGTCPLGCGNSLLFSDLLGVNPLTETSVGELMINSVDDTG